MRVRVTRIERSLLVTQARPQSGDHEREVAAEGTMVLYRPPAADSRPRWLPTELSVPDVLDRCHRVAVVMGEGAAQRFWFSSPVVYHKPTTSGYWVRTQSSTYLVEVLDEGITHRPERRMTGNVPVVDWENQ